MLDLKFIREHTDLVRKGIAAKRDIDRIDEILALDERRRVLIREGEGLKAKKNEVSAKVGVMAPTWAPDTSPASPAMAPEMT